MELVVEGRLGGDAAREAELVRRYGPATLAARGAARRAGGGPGAAQLARRPPPRPQAHLARPALRQRDAERPHVVAARLPRARHLAALYFGLRGAHRLDLLPHARLAALARPVQEDPPQGPRRQRVPPRG